jgi:hypothetical protein
LLVSQICIVSPALHASVVEFRKSFFGLCLLPFLDTDVSRCPYTLLCISGFQIQEGLEERTQSPEACASDCPLQVCKYV